MRFMMLVKADKSYEAGNPPDPRLMAAIEALRQEAAKKGQFVMSGGLAPSSMSSRVTVGEGGVTVVDGPFAETKELVGGFAIFDLASREEAVAMARRFMEVHREILGPSYEGECEVRPMFG